MLENGAVQRQRADLAAILYEKSYLEGEFTLSSGRKSDYYFDCRQTSLYPPGARLIGSLFLHMLEGLEVQALAGMTLGADPLLTAVSLAALDAGRILPALIVRKQAKSHGAALLVEGLKNVRPGDRVVMLEDVVSTGASVLQAAERIEQAGLEVAAVLCILNREEPGCAEAFAAARRELKSLFTRGELTRLARPAKAF
ncbi:MAG: orotate phosphoribosyltransferase [Desulfovibrio sp.]|jgi:orotate phosphoribosyltransferase|nr:orotate phosphoribosyltransferase [Desulfovibrio sp.]